MCLLPTTDSDLNHRGHTHEALQDVSSGSRIHLKLQLNHFNSFGENLTKPEVCFFIFQPKLSMKSALLRSRIL